MLKHTQKSLFFSQLAASLWRDCGPLPFQAHLTLPCSQMFHWRTYTWESLGCIQLLVNSLPQSSSCKQKQPKKNKIFSKLSWPRTELDPEMQMAACVSVKLCREAHLPSLIFKDGFHWAEGFFFWRLEKLDTETTSNAACGALYCLQLPVHLSEFLAKSI